MRWKSSSPSTSSNAPKNQSSAHVPADCRLLTANCQPTTKDLFKRQSFVNLLLIALVFLLLSCKSKKILSAITEDSAVEKLTAALSKVSVDYNWYSAKAKVRIETPEMKGGGRMNIRMIKDSLIWFNFKKISIEGARGLVTPDTFTMIYRQEKMYEKGNLQDLLDHYELPLTFSEIQFYIAGNIPIPHEKTLTYKRNEDEYYLLGSNAQYSLRYAFDRHLNLKAFSLTDAQNRKLTIELKDKNEEQGIYMGRKLYFPYDDFHAGKLEINLSNVEIDVPKNMPFSIPSHYNRY